VISVDVDQVAPAMQLRRCGISALLSTTYPLQTFKRRNQGVGVDVGGDALIRGQLGTETVDEVFGVGQRHLGSLHGLILPLIQRYPLQIDSDRGQLK